MPQPGRPAPAVPRRRRRRTSTLRRAGYRLYSSDEHVAALRFIRQAQALGLTLAEIGDILTIRGQGTPTCRHVLQLLDRRITEIDRTIADLRQLRRTLATTREHAAESVAPDTVCGIIEHHGSDAEEA